MIRHWKWLLVFGLAIFLLYCQRGPVGRTLLTSYMKHQTGLVVQAGEVSVGQGIRMIRLEDVTFREPDTLAPMLRLSHVEAEMGFLALIRRPMKLQRLALGIEYLKLERSPRGRVQIAAPASTQAAIASKARAASPKEPVKVEKEAEESPREIFVETLLIEVRDIEYIDRSRGQTPLEMSLSMNIKREYRDITSLEDLADRMSEDLLGNFLGAGGQFF